MRSKYAIGLDFGTNSVRALIVDVTDGNEVGNGVYDYEQGDRGVIIEDGNPNLARQHPRDYLKGIELSVRAALQQARETSDCRADDIVGIGVDATGSTPMPVDSKGVPLALRTEFENNPQAMAWLWKDHTAFEEAREISEKTKATRPGYLLKCGGVYSSEWFWSKILHCLRIAPEVFDAAATWVEIADWIPAELSGTKQPDRIKRGICAAGHKGMCSPAWGGYPDQQWIASVDQRLMRVRETLSDRVYTIADKAGRLTEAWAEKLGLCAGLPIAIGALDAHMGAVGSGIQPGVLVKIIGTSTCDMMVAPLEHDLPDIPGLCGIVPESILPGAFGLEAGQSAVGDIFSWFVNSIDPGGIGERGYDQLTSAAQRLRPGQSGLVCLDWHNGNRTVLIDQRLTGMIVGLTLHSKPEEIYRALVEATAFGARTIIQRFEEYGLTVERIVNCGGVSYKNPMVMQIYADVTGRTLEISKSDQTCALGSAIAGAVVAGANAGGHDSFEAAIKTMTGQREQRFKPIAENVQTYDRIYKIYQKLHDAFGTTSYCQNLYGVMKELLQIRDEMGTG